MSSDPGANWIRTASSEHAFPWELTEHAHHGAAASYNSNPYQDESQQYLSNYPAFASDGTSYAPYAPQSTSYAPQHVPAVQLEQLRAAYPGFSDEQLLAAIYTPSSHSQLSHAQPNQYYGSTLDSALAFTPSDNASYINSSSSSSVPSAAVTQSVSQSSEAPVRTSMASSSASAARTSSPVKTVPKAVKTPGMSAADKLLWSKLEPNMARLKVERDPAPTARDMIAHLSENDAEGRFRKPVSTSPELRELIVRGLAVIANLEHGKGYTENGRRKFLGAWIGSPAGRHILANWLRQTVRPKNVSEGVPDISKLYKATLRPLLDILHQVPMQASYLQDAAGPAKVLTGVVSRASDPSAQKLAAELKAKWTEIYDKAGSTSTSNTKAASPVTSNAATAVAKRKALESVTEPTKRYKSTVSAPKTSTTAPAKPGLSFFASSKIPPIPKKATVTSKTPAKQSAHQSIQALMNTVISSEQKSTQMQSVSATELAKTKGSMAKKVKRVSWRDDADLVAVRWIEGRDAEQERQEGHADFTHEGDALKRAVSTMEEQIPWHQPRPLLVDHGSFPSAEESVEGPFQTERHAKLPAVTYMYDDKRLCVDESQVNQGDLSSPAPKELLGTPKEIFLPYKFLPAEQGDVPINVADNADPAPDEPTLDPKASSPEVNTVSAKEASADITLKEGNLAKVKTTAMAATEPAPPGPPPTAPQGLPSVASPRSAPTMPTPAIQSEEAKPPEPPQTAPQGPPSADPPGPSSTAPSSANYSDVAALLAKVKGIGAKLAESGAGIPAPAAKLDMDLLQSILQNAKSSGTSSLVPGQGIPTSGGPNVSSLLANLSSSVQSSQPPAGTYWQQPYVQAPSMPISSYPGEYNEDYTMQSQSSAIPTQPAFQQASQQQHDQNFGTWDNSNMTAYSLSKLHTKPCKFFATGQCWRGDNCNFLHG